MMKSPSLGIYQQEQQRHLHRGRLKKRERGGHESVKKLRCGAALVRWWRGTQDILPFLPTLRARVRESYVVYACACVSFVPCVRSIGRVAAGVLVETAGERRERGAWGSVGERTSNKEKEDDDDDDKEEKENTKRDERLPRSVTLQGATQGRIQPDSQRRQRTGQWQRRKQARTRTRTHNKKKEGNRERENRLTCR